MDPVVIEQLGVAHPLARHVGDFLADLANANASAPTEATCSSSALTTTARPVS
jgi:hypothetical protein